MSKSLRTAVVAVVLLSTLAGTATVAWAGGPAGVPVSGDQESGAQESRALATGGDQSLDRLGDGAPGDGPTPQLAGEQALASGSTYWSGARLRFDASRVVPEDANEADRTFELWRVTEDGRLNQRIRTFTVDGDGTAVVRTGDLGGRVAVRYGQQIVYVHDGVGYLESPPDGSQVTPGSAAVEFRRQTLESSWSDPSVYPGQRVTLTLASNRDDYAVAVSGNNLSFQNLTTVFPESAYAENFDARANDSKLIVRAGAESSYRLDTEPMVPGDGSLRFEVVDTAAARTAPLTVVKPGSEGRFVSIERRENVGDVVEANVSCEHCFLVVGGPGQGLIDVVEIRDTNGDGHVRLDVNTRWAGMNTGQPGYPTNVDAYTSPEDSVDRYKPGATLEALDEALNTNYAKLSALRAQQGLESTGRTRPIDPGTIRMTLTTSDYVLDRSAYGSGPPHGGEIVVRDETDVRMVDLEPRHLDGVETLAAPGGPRLPANADALHDSVGPRESVALGDHLVFRFDVSGLYGYFHTEGASVATVGDNRGEGIRLTLEELPDGSSQDAVVRPLASTALRVYAHPDSDSLYVAVQTGGTSRTNFQAGQYRATLSLTGVAGERGYSTVNAYDGYPYVPAGRSESASATATLEPPTASIEGPAEGSEPRLNVDGALDVNGTTSLAPGGTLQLRATATEYAWETTATATVEENGTWSGAIPLADAPGDEFTVTLSRGETQFDERTYTVRPPPENPSGGDGSGGEGGSGGDGGPLAGGEGGILSTLTGLGGLAVPIGVGVGALVVVWALWKLVIRRLLI